MSIDREAKLNINVLVDLGDGLKRLDTLNTGIKDVDAALSKTRAMVESLRTETSDSSLTARRDYGAAALTGYAPGGMRSSVGPSLAPSAGGSSPIAPPTPPSSFYANAQSGFGGFNQVSNAAGAGALGQASSSLGGVAGAAASGGPAGIAVAGAVAALTLFKIGVEKTTTALEIAQAPYATTAQKMRAMEDEFIPFAGKLHALSDAISGVTARIQIAQAESARAIARIDAQAGADTSKRELQQQADQYRAQAFGMGSANIAPGQIFNAMTSSGRIQIQEQNIRLAAQDAITNQQRISAGADEQARLSRGRVSPLTAAVEQAQAAQRVAMARSREAMDAENRPAQNVRPNSMVRALRFAASPLAAGYMEYRENRQETIGGVRNQAGRAEADAALQVANRRLRVTGDQEVSAQTQARSDEMDALRQRNELQKTMVELQKAELQVMQQRSQRMEADAMRLGSMTRGQRRQARRSAQLVQNQIEQGGDDAEDRLVGTGVFNAFRAYNPLAAADIERRVGAREAADYSANEGRNSAMGQDWARGSLGDTLQQEQQLALEIRQRLSDIGQSSAREMATAFESTMRRMIDLIDLRMQLMIDEFETRFRDQANNRRAI